MLKRQEFFSTIVCSNAILSMPKTANYSLFVQLMKKFEKLNQLLIHKLLGFIKRKERHKAATESTLSAWLYSSGIGVYTLKD
jgi:hypothetical protein